MKRKDEKKRWKVKWGDIINEYELMLRTYISKDFMMDENWEKIQKPKKGTFDKIFYMLNL